MYVAEQNELNDDSLNKELSLMDTLLKQKIMNMSKEVSAPKDDWQFKQ